MALSATAVKQAKPGAKLKRLADERGLSLEVTPKGRKRWRFRYRINGTARMLSLGVYPDITLQVARERRDEARRLVANGIDPSETRKAAKGAEENTFEFIAREWFLKHKPKWVYGHWSKVLARLENDLFPWLGSRPIAAITAPEVLKALRRIESRGAVDTAHRAKQDAGRVFRYAVATGRAERDPTGDLQGAIPPPKSGHFAAIIEPKAVGELLRAIEGYQGSYIVRAALKLAPLTIVRPGELRRADWAEFDLDAKEWRIPPERMKMRAAHIVPLSRQAVQVLKDLSRLTGGGRYVFPGARSDDRPMSENAVLAALRRMGYTGAEMTGHGFRSMASTLLNEQGWNADVIERQLAHVERNSVRAAYNRAQYLPERRRMMQAWADYLDSLRGGADVVAIGARGGP